MTSRERLPHRRMAETLDLEMDGLRFRATIGRYPDGRVGEIFLNASKAGSAADTAAMDSAVVASIALQHGIEIDVLRRALNRDSRGAPIGPLGVVLDMLAAEETEGDT
jgi:hypothetical protein